MSEQEKWADKIAALLAKAESTTPEEAESIFTKVQELMTKYAIDQAMLDAKRMLKGEAAHDVIGDEIEFVRVGGFRVALGDITYRVLLNQDCKAILLGGENWRKIDGKVYKQTYVLRATGYKSDLERAKLLDASLQLQAMTALTRWWNENKGLYGQRDGFLARRQFLFSFAVGMGEKMAAAKKRATAEKAQEHGTGMELVLRDRSKMVMDKFHERYPRTKNVNRRQSAGDAWAAGAGREAGRNADIGVGHLSGGGKAIGK